MAQLTHLEKAPIPLDLPSASTHHPGHSLHGMQLQQGNKERPMERQPSFAAWEILWEWFSAVEMEADG